MVGSELNRTRRKRRKKTRGEWGESWGTPDSNTPSHRSIMTLSVNSRALVTLMRNGIHGRGDTSVIESRGHRRYYKGNRTFHSRGIFSRWAGNLLEDARLRQGRFRESSDRLWGELDFSTHSIDNERYQRKIWRVNFDDHHRCAFRSHNERPSWTAQAIRKHSNRHRLVAVRRHRCKTRKSVEGVRYGSPENQRN